MLFQEIISIWSIEEQEMTSNSKEELRNKISELEKEIWEKEKQVVELKKSLAEKSVLDYEFDATDGKVNLSELFDNKDDLIIIHNMGNKCPYCTMWADGFNGLLHHLTDRAAFVVVSPYSPEVQHTFAQTRGWKFKMVSTQDSSFTKDMGYEFEDKKYIPGVSVFHKDDTGKIERTGMDVFGPGDNYNSPWHLFQLLKYGVNEWHPKFEY